MKDTTTNLTELLAGKNFVWGTILEWWHVGNISICKYECRYPEEGVIQYRIWLDGKDTMYSAITLDVALVVAISIDMPEEE